MFLFDHEAIDMAQSADAVTVQVRGPSGVISQHSGVYLIGVDGGRSTVRRRSGISVAETFRKGRVLLAGDAAHFKNPIGGMGLNGGIQDAGNLSDELLRIMRDGAPERPLDLYYLQRRTVAIEFVQELSIANKKRLEARDPEVRKRNLDELRASAAAPARARQFLLRTSMIASQRRAQAMALAD